MAFELDLSDLFEPAQSAVASAAAPAVAIEPEDMINGRGLQEEVRAVVESEATEPESSSQEDETIQAEFETTKEEVEIPFDQKPWRTLAEQSFDEDVEQAKEELTNAAMERARAEEEFKQTKAEEKAALKSLRTLLANGPDYGTFKKEWEEQQQQANESSQEVDGNTEAPSLDGSSEASQPIEPTTTQPAYANWEDAPVSDLEISDSLLEKLYSVNVETMGELEEFRAAIANGKKEWPKGVGTAKITAIEDAALAWLSKNRDRAVFESVAK